MIFYAFLGLPRFRFLAGINILVPDTKFSPDTPISPFSKSLTRWLKENALSRHKS